MVIGAAVNTGDFAGAAVGVGSKVKIPQAKVSSPEDNITANPSRLGRWTAGLNAIRLRPRPPSSMMALIVDDTP